MSATPLLSAETLFCVMQRRDGVGVGLTHHDRSMVKWDSTFEPAPGLAEASVMLCSDLFSSRAELTGALSSGGFRQEDIVVGRWSAASILLLQGDWFKDEEPDLLFRGELGATRYSSGKAVAEVDLRPPVSHDRPCPQTSAECRATLGDAKCRVDMRARSVRAAVVSEKGLELELDLTDTHRFRCGKVRWLTGPNSGLDQYVTQTSPSRIALRELPPSSVKAGDKLQLHEGCDGRLQSCAERFGNVENFRGEPHLPGTDFITRYPGA